MNSEPTDQRTDEANFRFFNEARFGFQNQIKRNKTIILRLRLPIRHFH